MSTNKDTSTFVNLTQLISNIPIRRKLTDQNDRDKFEWYQWQSATKAINNVEAPVKEKHARNLILGTFRLEGARLFWSMIVRIHIESHPITCWKFCYVIHRLLKDGHKYALSDTILLSSYFEQLHKFWSGLQQNYGQLTYRYCHLLVSKLKFHERYPIFTGHLTISESNKTIHNLFDNNSNSYSQLCTDLFDYLEELLNLIQVIFTSLDQSRANSMTTTGQCRLNPIIICIQDSSLLYDYIVKIIFKLHECLPSETLQTHRNKLNDQFQRLKRFYRQASMLQYFKNIVQVPILAENPPNFNIKDDLNKHKTPIAIVNSSADETDDLIDLSPKSSLKATTSDNNGVSNRSKDIAELEQRLMQYDTMLQQNRSETDDLHRTIAARDAELIAEKNHRLQLEEQLRQQSENQKRLEDMHAIDNKKNSDEKFNKLREEHIAVLHRESELKKQLADLNQQLIQLKEEHKKKENELNETNKKLDEELLQLRQTNDELQDRIQILTTERNDYQTITLTANERIKQIEHARQTVEERYKELENDKTRVDHDKTIYQKRLEETEGARRNLIHKNREHEEDLIDLVHEKETLEQKVLDLEQIIDELSEKCLDTTNKQKLIETNNENLLNNLKRQYKYSILSYCINQMQDAIDRKQEIKIVDNTEYLLSKLENAVVITKKIQDLWKKQNENDESTILPFLNECTTLANHMADIIICGKTIPNLVNDCRDVTNYCINLYTNYQTSSTFNDIDKQSNELISRLNLLVEKTKKSLK